jgi:hypothetical protein
LEHEISGLRYSMEGIRAVARAKQGCHCAMRALAV